MDRSYYEALTNEALKTICRKNKIPGYSGLKKKDLVDLILETTQPGTQKVRKKQDKPKVSKATAKRNTEDELDKQAAIEYMKELTTKKKPEKELPPLKHADVTKKITEEMYAEKKPTGVLYISTISSAMQNIEMYIESDDRTRAIENAEQIKEYLDSYSFLPHFEKAMQISIKSVIDAFGSPGTKRKIFKAKTPVKKGDYKTVNIENVKIGKKCDILPTDRQKKISITLDELRKEIDNDAFINDYVSSIRDLMKAKIKLYQKRKKEIQQEYESINRKVTKLKAMGTDDRAIRDMYPGFDGLKVFIIDLDDLILLVKKRSSEVSEENIRNGLIEAIEDSEYGLNSMVGREDVKNQLASQIYSFSKGYRTFIGSFNNIAIYGSSGTGKTNLAIVIAFALSKIGILARDTVKIVTRSDLIGQYIGQTGPRTRSALVETLEGILFIDEAYQLTPGPGNDRDFGSEAITEIVNFLDKYIGLNIVIVAGYEGVMTRCFMASNEGLPRRFPYRYVLSSYSDEELTDILITNLKKKLPEKNLLDTESDNFIFSLVSKIRAEIPDSFKNQAGDMLNLSASLNKTISSSFQITWENGNLENNIPIILSGFDDFLELKGFSLRG